MLRTEFVKIPNVRMSISPLASETYQNFDISKVAY